MSTMINLKEILDDGKNFIKNINTVFDGAEKIAVKIKNGHKEGEPDGKDITKRPARPIEA